MAVHVHHQSVSLVEKCIEGLQDINNETRKSFPTVRDAVGPPLNALRTYIENKNRNGTHSVEDDVAKIRENSHIVIRPYVILWRHKKTPKHLLTKTLHGIQPLISSHTLAPEDTFDIFTSISKRVSGYTNCSMRSLLRDTNETPCRLSIFVYLIQSNAADS